MFIFKVEKGDSGAHPVPQEREQVLVTFVAAACSTGISFTRIDASANILLKTDKAATCGFTVCFTLVISY